jgi:hypothetical protein
MRRPALYREILDRVAAEEARTLTAIGGDELAAAFLRTYEAAEPSEVLSPEAAFVVHIRSPRGPVSSRSAPSIVPALPAKSQQKVR